MPALLILLANTGLDNECIISNNFTRYLLLFLLANTFVSRIRFWNPVRGSCMRKRRTRSSERNYAFFRYSEHCQSHVMYLDVACPSKLTMWQDQIQQSSSFWLPQFHGFLSLGVGLLVCISVEIQTVGIPLPTPHKKYSMSNLWSCRSFCIPSPLNLEKQKATSLRGDIHSQKYDGQC